MTILSGHFNDELPYDKKSKTAISFRDGVLTYLGAELGLEPADKEFTVYRSPATIANASRLMDNLPLTDEHVSLDGPPERPVGTVIDATMSDLFDEQTGSTVGVRNRIEVTDAISGALETGKRQLSLGYGADLVPHDKWDFEQKEILPHHLAVVQAGRCGPSCAFIDHKPSKEDSDMSTKAKQGQQATKPADNGVKLAAVFTDAEGAPNMEQIVEVFQQLPEAARKLPIDKLQEFLPMLQELVALAGGSTNAEQAPEDAGEPDAEMDADMTDEGDMSEEEKTPITDSAAFKDAIAKALDEDRKRLCAVIDKAKDFVDAGYSYHGKSAEQIMRDALAVEHADAKFADNELDVAFKLLKRSESNLKNFGDGAPDANTGRFTSLQDKEL